MTGAVVILAAWKGFNMETLFEFVQKRHQLLGLRRSAPVASQQLFALLLCLSPQIAIASGTATFDVVSIKPSDPSAIGEQAFPMPGGKFRAVNLSVRRLIAIAYGFRPYEILEGPDWISSARYDINAQGDPAASPKELLGMVQALLQDRFGLQFHRESRIAGVYELVVAKSGLRMKEVGAPGRGLAPRPGNLKAFGSPVSLLAAALSDQLDRKVIDKTDLTGYYDFSLAWAADDLGNGVAGDSKSPDSPPSLFTALPEQLGLQLKTAKAQVEHMIVDTILRPSAN